MSEHRALQIWLALMVFSVVTAGAITFWQPGATGYFTYDTGETPEFNPDFVQQEDLGSQLWATLIVIVSVIGVQILVYSMITRFYSKLES